MSEMQCTSTLWTSISFHSLLKLLQFDIIRNDPKLCNWNVYFWPYNFSCIWFCWNKSGKSFLLIILIHDINFILHIETRQFKFLPEKDLVHSSFMFSFQYVWCNFMSLNCVPFRFENANVFKKYLRVWEIFYSQNA